MPPGICPHCGAPEHAPVTFSWWGGLLGPKLLHHVKCLRCGKTFNARTGRTNDTAIAIYLAVGVVISVGLLVAFYTLLFSGGL